MGNKKIQPIDSANVMYVLSDSQIEQLAERLWEQKANDASVETEILYTQKEVEGLLKVDEVTLWRWRTKKDGYLPYLKIGGKVRYRKSDIDKLINGK